MLTREERRELVVHLWSLRFRRAQRTRYRRSRLVARMGWSR